MVTGTSEAFSETVARVRKVSELVGEIAAASTEQAKGIEQINQAVIEMDKVTQQNAASAEESASASEEMNAQAEEMHAIVNALVRVVGGVHEKIREGKDPSRVSRRFVGGLLRRKNNEIYDQVDDDLVIPAPAG